MKNHVWYLTAPGQVTLVEDTLPQLENDDVLVDVEACGICMYDYYLYSGKIIPGNPPYPHPLGHEAVGTVLEVGRAVTYCQPGDRVGIIHGFAFAEKILCKERELAKVPSSGEAVLYITEPLTCVVQFMNNFQFLPGHTVVILGLGYMGLLILQMIPSSCSKVFAVDPREQTHVLAKDLGASAYINPKTVDPLQVILAECPDGVDIVIDACGGIKSVVEATPSLLKHSFSSPGSQWGFFSSPPQPLNVELNVEDIVNRGIRFINSGTHDRLKDNRTAAALLCKGAVCQEQLITHRFGFQEVPKAMETKASLSSDWIKGVILMK